MDLGAHELELALHAPEIAPNTGNAARLCVATGTPLHLIRPLGFVLSDRNLKRSAMDYWERLKLTVHDDDNAFFSAMAGRRVWLLSSKAKASFWEARFQKADVLLMGNESKGLPAEILGPRTKSAIRIPQAPGERCLNLSTAAGIALYEAIRQVQRGA